MQICRNAEWLCRSPADFPVRTVWHSRERNIETYEPVKDIRLELLWENRAYGLCDYLRKASNVVCAGLHSCQIAWRLDIQKTPAQYVRCQKHHQRWSNASKVDCVCQSTVMKQETTSWVIFCEQLQPQSVDSSYVHGQYIFSTWNMRSMEASSLKPSLKTSSA